MYQSRRAVKLQTEMCKNFMFDTRQVRHALCRQVAVEPIYFFCHSSLMDLTLTYVGDHPIDDKDAQQLEVIL